MEVRLFDGHRDESARSSIKADRGVDGSTAADSSEAPDSAGGDGTRSHGSATSSAELSGDDGAGESESPGVECSDGGGTANAIAAGSTASSTGASSAMPSALILVRGGSKMYRACANCRTSSG